MTKQEVTYQAAGVDTAEGARAVDAIKETVHSTYRPEVVGDIGGFGGLFSIAAAKDMAEPLLVSGTDGVGTKLKVAQLAGKHGTVGIDLVAMCVNDILACGAEPLFFLDYIAIGKLRKEHVAEVVAGIGEGCRQAGCALIGGEMAEHPGVMDPDDYDLSGFTVGVVDKPKMLDPESVSEGDVLIGLASSGLHSNGYSLARKVCVEGKSREELLTPVEALDGQSVADALLTPTRIYVKQVLEVIRSCDVHGISHITGGGFDENIPRILHEGQGLEIEEGTWEILPVFRFLEKYGKVAHREMFNIFNMGIGMVIALDAAEAQKAIGILTEQGERATVIGRVTDTEGVVIR